MEITDTYIKLCGVRFHAFHGVMPHETISGNEFEIDLILHFPAQDAMSSGELSQTINYALVYELLKEEMANPKPLLEEVCHTIINRLHQDFPNIQRAEIALTKLMPPIAGFQGKGVTFSAKVVY